MQDLDQSLLNKEKITKNTCLQDECEYDYEYEEEEDTTCETETSEVVKPSLIENANFFSRLFFNWSFPIIKVSFSLLDIPFRWPKPSKYLWKIWAP